MKEHCPHIWSDESQAPDPNWEVDSWAIIIDKLETYLANAQVMFLAILDFLHAYIFAKCTQNIGVGKLQTFLTTFTPLGRHRSKGCLVMIDPHIPNYLPMCHLSGLILRVGSYLVTKPKLKTLI